ARSGRPRVETCPSGAVDRPGDLLDGLPDGLINGKPIDTTSSPRMSQTEWAWGGIVMLGPTDPAPNNAVPSTYLYTPEAGGTPVPLPFVDTLNAAILEWHGRFGWAPSHRWVRGSRGHGHSSSPRGKWYLRPVFHPNAAGYQGEAQGLLAEAKRLGLKVD